MGELSRQNHDLNGLKIRLSQENFELQRQIQDLDGNCGAMGKAKAQLTVQLDDAKSRLGEESRQRNALSIQITNIQVDFDALTVKHGEEAEAATLLRQQNAKISGEYGTLKSRYDKDILMKLEEIEDIKRKTGARLVELEDLAEQAKSRAAKFGKEKQKLSIEIREISIELETVQVNCTDLAKRLKVSDSQNAELLGKVDGLSADLGAAQNENGRLLADLTRIKVTLQDLEDKNSGLLRDNKHLSEALREAQTANKDLGKQIHDLFTIRAQLEAERDAINIELIDTRDALKDLTMRYEAANAQLTSVRSECEAKLHSSLRCSAQTVVSCLNPR